MKEIRILLVDDEIWVRRGLRMRLSLEPDMRVVGEAGNGDAALVLAAHQAPDVVLMDLRMPMIDGLTATVLLKERFPDLPVLALSMHDDPQAVAAARNAGAARFIPKHKVATELLAAIRSVARSRAPDTNEAKA